MEISGAKGFKRTIYMHAFFLVLFFIPYFFIVLPALNFDFWIPTIGILIVYFLVSIKDAQKKGYLRYFVLDFIPGLIYIVLLSSIAIYFQDTIKLIRAYLSYDPRLFILSVVAIIVLAKYFSGKTHSDVWDGPSFHQSSLKTKLSSNEEPARTISTTEKKGTGYETIIYDNKGHGAKVWKETAKEAEKDASISFQFQKERDQR